VCSKSAGQFFYTINQFVDECPYVEGSDTVPPPDFRGPKIVFEPNQSRKVIPFAPSVPVSIPASEALGRPFVQLKLSHFTEFYGLSLEGTSETDGSLAPLLQTGRARKQGRKRKATAPPKAVKELMMLLVEASSDSANKVFEREIVLMKERYQSLAKWMGELLQKKKEGEGES